MKRDENETLCWIMRWGWITWKWSLAFNNDDGKKLYNLFTKKNKKIKTNYHLLHLLHLLHLTSTLPAVFSLCPCTLPWNRNQKTIKGKIFKLLTRTAFWDSELQTIIYTDLSLSAHINCLACLSLSLRALHSSSSFSLLSSSSFFNLFRSALLKI